MKGIGRIIISYSFILFSIVLSISLVGFSPNDLPFYSSGNNLTVINWFGALGVHIATPFVFFYGWASWVWVPFSLILGLRILTGIDPKTLAIRFLLVHCLAVSSAILSALIINSYSFVEGGVFGVLAGGFLLQFIPRMILIPIFTAFLLWLLTILWQFPRYIWNRLSFFVRSLFKSRHSSVSENSFSEDYDDELEEQYLEEQYEEEDIEDIGYQAHKNYSKEIADYDPFFREEEEVYGDVSSMVPDLSPEEMLYVNRSKVPDFLDKKNEAEQDEFYPVKKRLIDSKEPSFLQDVDVDFLSSYRRERSSFYHKIEENYHEAEGDDYLLELDQSSGDENVFSVDPQSIYEVDQSQDFVVPANKFQISSEVSRLSFDDGFIKSELISGHLDDSENQRAESSLEPTSNSELKISDDSEISNKNLEDGLNNIDVNNTLEQDEVTALSSDQILNEDVSDPMDSESETAQHSSKFPPLEEDFFDNSPIILNSNFDQDLSKEEIPTLEFDDELSDSEKILLQGLERTNLKKQIEGQKFSKILNEKHSELAHNYYQLNNKEPEKPPIESQDNFSLESNNGKNSPNNLESLSMSIDPLIMQDLENEILELKQSREKSLYNTVSDDHFLEAYHQERNIVEQNPEKLTEDIKIDFSDQTDDVNNSDNLEDFMISIEESDTVLDQEEQNQKDDMLGIDTSTIDTKKIAEEIKLEAQHPSYMNELSNIQEPIEESEELQKIIAKDDAHDSMNLTDLETKQLFQELDQEFHSADQSEDRIYIPGELEYSDSNTDYGIGEYGNENNSNSTDTSLESTKQLLFFDSIDSSVDSESLFSPSVEDPSHSKDDNISPTLIDQKESDQDMFVNFDDESVQHTDTVSEEEIDIYDIVENTEELESQPLVAKNFSMEYEENNNQEYENQNVRLEESEILQPIEEIFPIDVKSLGENSQNNEKEKMLHIYQSLMPEQIEEKSEEHPIVSEGHDITDLEPSESALMPSVTIKSHLIDAQANLMKNPDSDLINVFSEEEGLESKKIQEQKEKEKDKEEDKDKEKEYIFPKASDLEPNTDQIDPVLEDLEIEDTMKMIEDTYESFNINMQVVDFNRGPTITRFELDPPSGLKLRTILNLQDDLALQAGTSNLRIISPVEGRSYIGIEVPNKIRRNFLLRQQIESSIFQESSSALPLILGVNVGGKELVDDLAKTPHLLIAGTTGSGKSVYVNALIMGLLYKLSSEDLKFIMIDPKMVELELYNGIPHLLAPIITKPEEAMAALEWAVQEMDRRYQILSELGVRNLKEYQMLAKDSNLQETVYEKLPYIVIIVDEFANLMLRAPKDTEKHISRLASMARAVGMHLVLATQRPSVDVVTGVIKANFPSRIAFRVTSKIDSRTIIDKNGAESLLGRGDMLFMSPEYMEPVRIQSPFVSSEDVAHVVNIIKKNGAPEYSINFSELIAKKEENSTDGSRTDAISDPLFAEVLRYAVDNGEISASGIQRRFRVGYNRASRLIETMKDMKIISPPSSAGKGCLINITRDQIADYID